MLKHLERLRLFEPGEVKWILPRRTGLMILAANERQPGRKKFRNVALRRPGSVAAKGRRIAATNRASDIPAAHSA
mgnify:CR=1 FL=1